MVKEIEVLGTPPPLGKLLAEDFDLVDSCSGDEDHDFCESYELIDPLAEADFGRLCSKDGTIGDTLSWAAEMLRRQAPVSDIAIILDMLALHVGRLRLTRVSEGVVVDLYADKMDDLARVRHESNQNYANESIFGQSGIVFMIAWTVIVISAAGFSVEDFQIHLLYLFYLIKAEANRTPTYAFARQTIPFSDIVYNR
jgi:hypothetical protein